MGIPAAYQDDEAFLVEMERMASISKSPTNWCRVQTKSLQRLIALARRESH